MSLGARATKGGAKGGKDRQEKKDKPQPKEKVKPQATTEQIRMANMIDRKTSDDGADVRKMVQDLMEMTCRTEEEVCSALHDTDNDVVAACNILLEEKTGEWQTSEKKKKKPPQPVNNGEAAPRERPERGPPGPRPRRGDSERGPGGERGDRLERGRGAGRGGRGGGRGGRGGARGRGPPRPRQDRGQEWHPDFNNDTNQMGDAFPATEDWDNEEWSGSLSDTKVFTPSAAAMSAEPDAMLPPTEDWESPVSHVTGGGPVADHIPTYTYHSTQPHHVNIEQLNSGSRASPATPSAEEHYLQQHLPPAMLHPRQLPPQHAQHPIQPMGMSGSLTAAQSQYLSQLTQQSQRHDASVYTSTYGVYGSTDTATQRKPQRARVPPPSKIPVSAVEMPGGEPCGMFLDVQFGALEPDALRDPASAAASASAAVSHTQHAPTSNHVPAAAAPAAPSPVAEPPLPATAPPAAPAPASLPAPSLPPKQTYEPHHHTHHTILNESLSSVEPTAPTQAPPVTAEPASTTNAQSSLEKQLTASMKQLSVSACDSAPANSVVAHQPYAPTHRPKQQTVTQQQQQQQNVYAHHPVSHHPAAVYGASVYAPQVNSTNASLSAAAAAGISTGYPASVTLTQYQPILNSYQTSSSAGVYNNSALYTAAAAPYSYQPQPHHKHKDTPHQYDTSSAAASNSLTSTSTTSQTSTAKVATTTAGHTTASGSNAAGGSGGGGGGGAYAGGALYGSQGYAPYDEQMMRSTMPHHMGGYYEVGYGVSSGREAGFGLSAGERFGRTDAASPQQVPAAALPPGYAYFYQPPPTSYQYGVYPTYGGGSSVGGVGGVGGVSAGGKVTSYAQQQQPQYDAQDTYKPGGPYTGSASKAGGAAAADLTNAMYAKGHVALNKVNSYEKAAFHSGTPPPFGAASHLYIPAPPHHHHVPQQHQMDVRMNSSQNRRESGSTGGRAASNKQAHSKPTYSHSYWPPN